MDSWSDVVRQFYAQKLIEKGYHLGDSHFVENRANIPPSVCEAFIYFGGDDSDPQPSIYQFDVEGKTTYAITLTFGGDDGLLAAFAEEGDLLGAAFAYSVNDIHWFDSLDAISGATYE
ncbi:hypothetical protein DO97_20585 [Neosynechococcus sphagnicola sy1]|uniref:SMI1/KNR4 family protein n=1 Tax=Neosynechococcus sphagnicola sy1 TaxID=1497020 RepID=A0A098THG3_9CYAN|nr:hypothetical protein [Neosynechococcus sphagnicola]KGF71417.1 hypothetical protein DO97_20585 [Neosynechococcus sphagnicola sy1]